MMKAFFFRVSDLFAGTISEDSKSIVPYTATDLNEFGL